MTNKIILAHNSYQIYGGEDNVFSEEFKLLVSNGLFQIESLEVNNDIINSFAKKVKSIYELPFSSSGYHNVKNRLLEDNVTLAHIHNFFPLITPSFFYACQGANVPVVHTLHNYRTLCPTATLMYNGKVCERSLHGSAWWTVPNRVYRNSFIGTAALAYMVEYHKRKGTWKTQVDRYIALTEFAKNKFIEGGFPAEKISVKPNFVEDPHSGEHQISKDGGYAVFVGRLSEEKGLNILLDAWRNISYPLKIIGGGALENMVIKACSSNSNIEFLGFQDKEEILPLIKNADFLIMASTWYEGFPIVLLEAFSNSTPALVANIGGMAEIVNDQVTGLHFEVSDSGDLAEKAQYLIDNPKLCCEYGQNARLEYLEKYTPERNFEMLLDIYRQTIRDKRGSYPF